MLTRLVEDVRRTPERINYKREELSFRARQNLHTACGLTNERLFDARISVISQVASLLDRVDELPVIKRVTGPAHTRAAEYLADATSPVIEDYDNLNARAVNNALAELTRLQLVQTLRYESEHKARKTVVKAIEKAIARIDTLPTPEALRAAAA